MTRRTIVTITILVLLAAAVAGTVVYRLSRFVEPGDSAAGQPGPAAAQPSAAAQPRIKARLFYVADDGAHLVAVEREVPLGESPVEQARRVLEAQLAAPPAPLVSAVPAGTVLRAFFLTDEGRAIADLSAEARLVSPGGSTSERLAVYAIVDALTVNLPAITSVQILVDGQTVESLAGHVDLRRTFRKNIEIVAEPAAPSSGTTAPAPRAGV